MAEAVVLASGSGSNFEAIVHRVRRTSHTVASLICDQPDALCLQRAKRLRVPSRIVHYHGRRAQAERELLAILTEIDPDLVVLAGFMRILPAEIVTRFNGRMINIHPSILPAFPGLHAIERSFHQSDGPLGITVHYVDAGVDTGPVIEQHSIERDGVPDVQTAEQRIHQLEHRYYPEVVVRLLESATQKTTDGRAE